VTPAAGPGLALLASGGDFFESPRWHDGRWFVSDVYGGVVYAVGDGGELIRIAGVAGRPSGLGWLSDGTMLVVSMRDRHVLAIRDPGAADPHLEVYADLSGWCRYDLNDMLVVDDRVLVGTVGFELGAKVLAQPGSVYEVAVDGSNRELAGELWCPNGIVKVPGTQTFVVAESFGARLTAFDDEGGRWTRRRALYAEGDQPGDPGWTPRAMPRFVPDGLAVDHLGGVWVADPRNRRCIRVTTQGGVDREIRADEAVYACAIGGPSGETLLLCTAPGPAQVLAGERVRSRLLTTAARAEQTG
jgi:sugar lactone lactonase YvrE